MSEFFDYTPDTGMTYATDYDHVSDEIILHSKQDLQPVLDHTQRLRNAPDADSGIKKGFWLYAVIPPAIELAMLEKGINIHKRDHQKAMFKEINQNYPYLKATDKHHA